MGWRHLLHKPHGPSSLSRTHLNMEGENGLYKVVINLHIGAVALPPPTVCVHEYNSCSLKSSLNCFSDGFCCDVFSVTRCPNSSSPTALPGLLCFHGFPSSSQTISPTTFTFSFVLLLTLNQSPNLTVLPPYFSLLSWVPFPPLFHSSQPRELLFRQWPFCPRQFFAWSLFFFSSFILFIPTRLVFLDYLAD